MTSTDIVTGYCRSCKSMTFDEDSNHDVQEPECHQVPWLVQIGDRTL